MERDSPFPSLCACPPKLLSIIWQGRLLIFNYNTNERANESALSLMASHPSSWYLAGPHLGAAAVHISSQKWIDKHEMNSQFGEFGNWGGRKYSTFPEHLCDDNSAPVSGVRGCSGICGEGKGWISLTWRNSIFGGCFSRYEEWSGN